MDRANFRTLHIATQGGSDVSEKSGIEKGEERRHQEGRTGGKSEATMEDMKQRRVTE